MKKMTILTILLYPLLFMVTLLFNFSYDNFFDSFKIYSYHFKFIDVFHIFSRNYFAFFLPFVIGEYYLYKKRGSIGMGILYLFPLSLILVGIVLFEITELISFKFIRCPDGFCLLDLVIFPLHVAILMGAWGLFRIAIVHGSAKNKEGHSALIYFIENLSSDKFKKIMFLFVGVMMIIVGIIFFDYKTKGAYLKISSQSTSEIWQPETIENNDLALCKNVGNGRTYDSSPPDLENCYLNFFEELNKDVYNQKYRDRFNFLNESYCSKKGIDNALCTNSILWSLRNLLKEDISKKIKDKPRILYGIDLNYALGSERPRLTNPNVVPNVIGIEADIKSLNWNEKVESIKHALNAKYTITASSASSYRINNGSIVITFSNYRKSIILAVVDSKEFFNEDTIFYQIYNEIIYPRLYTTQILN